ncbi:hypothetical protein, conserved [Eimeria maxima]|uniref:Uncharacterized protein n=1 Tax=Eimeria maxima TaxID=5804 RepID=U6MBB3_EIMMA|nr:hypothetical protein, conserved [Eimeria maxima]CDJ58955.1 hypothetical protein, conserved [Eimeria maxima]
MCWVSYVGPLKGGCGASSAQNWYPFRFFPGPFEPECEAGHSGASQTAVRWESDQALHERVHPLVHTGVSLHTSLMWKRGAEKQGGGPFRYAAWLRYLPELRLAPATVEWAKGMLSTRLQGCHDFLVQHLRGSESAAAGASADLPVDNDIAGETPNSLSSDKAQQELLMNKEADSQRVGDPSIVPPPAADAPKIPDTWAVQRGPPRESSVDTVSSTSPLHKCAPTPLPGTHTTSSCLDASFTAKGLVEITTWSSVSTLVGSGGLKGVSTAAELSALCSSGPYTPAERFQLPLPHAALARPSAKADSEGQCEYRSSTIGAPEEFHARQLHSIPPSNMASGVSRSGACSTSTPEAQRQVVCYEYVTSLASRLDLLGGSGRSATSKKTRGAPLTEMQPKQCSALSTAACNDMRDAQEIERTNGSLSRTVSTNLHKNKQESHGWSLESDSRIDIERSAPLSSAARRNRRCLRRLEGPIQQQKSSCELLSMSFRSHSNTFLGGVGIGEGVGIRRCPALRRRLTDSSGCIRGSPIASRSAARTSANMKAVSGSSGCRTLCISSAVEEQRLFKGAQRKATLPAVQTGHVFGRSQRMRLKEPKQTAPVLSPEPRFNVLHTQPLEVSSFLAERPIAVSPSSKAQDHPCASQGNAIAIHSPQSEVLRADSAHSKHNVLPLGKASADRSFMMAYDMKAECCEFPQSAKAQNLGKEGGASVPAGLGLDLLLHPCWITRKSIRLSNRVGLKGETTASTIGRSLAIHGASFWQLRTFIPKIFLCEAYFVAEFVMFRLIKAKTPDLACAWHVRDTVLALNGCPFQKCNNLIVEHTGR